jgi:hypothetical protein
MMWVAVLLTMTAVVWFVVAVKQEQTERIGVRELTALVELARRCPPVATALGHREAIREHRGDPDGSDPIITDIDRCVREVAKTSQRLVRLRIRRERATTRQATLGTQANKSIRGSESGDKAIDGSSQALSEKVQQLDVAIAALSEQLDKMLAHLGRVRETEKAKLEARLRPRRILQSAAEVSGLREIATRAANVVREVTQPRARLASASGGPTTLAPPPDLTAPPPSPPMQRAPAPQPQRSSTMPRATVHSLREQAPASVALGRDADTVEDAATVEEDAAQRAERVLGHRRAKADELRNNGKRPSGRKRKRSKRKQQRATKSHAIGRIEVKTSPAVKPLADRATEDPERTIVHDGR